MTDRIEALLKRIADANERSATTGETILACWRESMVEARQARADAAAVSAEQTAILRQRVEDVAEQARAGARCTATPSATPDAAWWTACAATPADTASPAPTAAARA
jgi:hypothetical protein